MGGVCEGAGKVIFKTAMSAKVVTAHVIAVMLVIHHHPALHVQEVCPCNKGNVKKNAVKDFTKRTAIVKSVHPDAKIVTTLRGA